MHLNTFILSLVTLAGLAVSTKDKDRGPRCVKDEYYNKMMESKNRKSAVTDCANWLGGTITDPKEIPKYLEDCGGDKDEDRVSRVSAACSCISPSSVPATSSATTRISSTQPSTAIVTTSSRSSTHQSSISVSPTGSTSRPQPTPSSNRATSTTSRPSSSQRPSTSLTAPGSNDYSVAPSEPPVNSVTTSTIYTESIYTITSCAPGKTRCPDGSTILVTSTIAVSTTICPVTETPRPSPLGQSSQQTTSTIYSTSTYTLTRCPPGAVNCPVGNLPITTIIPISTTVLPVTNTLPTPERGNDGVNVGKQEGTSTQPGVSNGNHEIPHTASTTFTVVTVPTTIVTTMNGVAAQILTVVPVTSAVVAGNNAHSAPTPSSAADDKHHAGSAQPASLGTSGSVMGNEPSISGFISRPLMPANNSTVTVSSSPRPPVVTAGGPGLAGSDGMHVAFLVFALAALL